MDWSAVNYKDAMVTRPGNRVARISPLVPGVDLVGTVLDSADPSIAAGSQVIVHGYDLGVAHHGGFAQLARVPAEWVVPLPDRARRPPGRRPSAPPASPPPSRSTGSSTTGLRPGDGPVLVTGATGGVGSMAVALLASRGYEVVASTGKADEADYLTGLGASEVIGRDDLLEPPSGSSGPNAGPGRSTAWAGRPWPPCCGPCATGRPWRPAA